MNMVEAEDGTVLNIHKVWMRQAAERTYLMKFEDPDYGLLTAVVSSICLENPNRLQDAKGYIAQYVLGIDKTIKFPYNSYPRMDALYDIVAQCERSRKENKVERIGYFEWVNEFKPLVKNADKVDIDQFIVDEDEAKEVYATEPLRVWSFIEADETYGIIEGLDPYACEFIITEKAAEPEKEYAILYGGYDAPDFGDDYSRLELQHRQEEAL